MMSEGVFFLYIRAQIVLAEAVEHCVQCCAADFKVVCLMHTSFYTIKYDNISLCPYFLLI